MVGDQKIEKLTTTVQKKLNGNHLLLIGSGASIAYGAPSMLDLGNEILAKLDAKYKTEDSWKSFEAEFNTSHNFELALEKNFLKEEIHESIIKIIWACIDAKDRQAINNFLQSNSKPEITPLLEKFVQCAGVTNIITTNYDRLLEFAIDSAHGIIQTGFSGDCIKSFGDSLSSNTQIKRIFNLYKVHGSVDWFKDKATHKLFGTHFFNDIAYLNNCLPMIVTPGNEKYRETHYDPFRTIMSDADKALRAASSYLCVGYGFNDDHIQQLIIDENRNNDKPVIIITKDVTPKIQELFLQQDKCNFLCICSKDSGSTVYYSKNEQEVFAEPFWKIGDFYHLWLE